MHRITLERIDGLDYTSDVYAHKVVLDIGEGTASDLVRAFATAMVVMTYDPETIAEALVEIGEELEAGEQIAKREIIEAGRKP